MGWGAGSWGCGGWTRSTIFAGGASARGGGEQGLGGLSVPGGPQQLGLGSEGAAGGGQAIASAGPRGGPSASHRDCSRSLRGGGAQTLPTPLPDPSRLWAFLWWPFSQYTVPAWLALTDP